MALNLNLNFYSGSKSRVIVQDKLLPFELQQGLNKKLRAQCPELNLLFI